ncbi:MAG TPA: heparin lyase I family protein [Polyangia bacterium]
MKRLRDTDPSTLSPQERVAAKALERVSPLKTPYGYEERVRRAIDARSRRKPRRTGLVALGLIFTSAAALAANSDRVRGWFSAKPAIVDQQAETVASPPEQIVRRWARRHSVPMLVVPGTAEDGPDWRALSGQVVDASTPGQGSNVNQWSAGFETGDRSEWKIGGPPDRIPFYEREGTQELVSHPVREGRQALKVTIDADRDRRRVSYLHRDGLLPREGRYSAWFYFPQRYTAGKYWSIMSFRGRTDPSDAGTLVDNLWNLTVYNRTDGTMALKLWDGARQRDLLQAYPQALPTERWVHIEVYFKQASDDTGRVAFWQDGVPVFDVADISTAPSEWISWLVGSVGRNVSPSPTVIYIDDVSISDIRSDGPQ